MSPSRPAPSVRLIALLGTLLAPSLARAAAPPRPAPQAQVCTPSTNANYVLYNRCTFAHIGDQGGIITCHPPAAIDGVIPIDANHEKVSYRFTLSPALAGGQAPTGIWLYFETRGAQKRYEVSLRRDNMGRPGGSLGRSRFWTDAVPGTRGWAFVPLTTAELLVPGFVYHATIAPVPGAQVDDQNCIVLITARSKGPLPYVPTDGTGAAVQTPFDPWLAVMKSPGAPQVSEYLVAGDTNMGLTPIFALDLGASGIVGQPYDGHRETTISKRDQYGQAIKVSLQQTINYAAFFVRGMGCPPPEGCPTATPNCVVADLPHPFGELRLEIRSPSNPQFQPVSATVIPANYPSHVYLKRSHWFGVTLPDVVLDPGTYYFVLRATDCGGMDPVQDHDGWVFTAQGSTLPLPDTELPTYQRAESYAIESHDNGRTFAPMQDAAPLDGKRWDAGFILGYFPGGLTTPLAILDDAGVDAQCSGAYANAVPLATRVLFTETNRNIGAVPAVGPNRIYLRLLDLDCNVLDGPVDGGEGLAIAPNLERQNIVQPLSCRTGFYGTTDAFFLLEMGHYENGVMVRDDLTPFEVRVGPCP